MTSTKRPPPADGPSDQPAAEDPNNPYSRRVTRNKGRFVSGTLAYVTLIVASVILVGPMFYLVSTSFKETTQLFTYPPEWIPRPPFWGNFLALLDLRHPFPRWAFNSVFVASVVTAIKLLIDSMAGYAFAKIDFPAKKTLFGLILVTVMIPTSAILIPLFLLVRWMGIINTYWALILPALASPIGVFLMRNYIQTLPSGLEDSARLDGCSEFAVYRRIILPLVKPGLVVLGILTFLTQYTAFLWPLIAVQDENLEVLTTGVASLKASIFTIDWGLLSAAGVLSMVPITILFLFFQKYFSGGSIAGAMKE